MDRYGFRDAGEISTLLLRCLLLTADSRRKLGRIIYTVNRNYHTQG